MKRQAVILAGGRGTRLKTDLPKALAEVGGVPILGHQLHLCRGHGFQDVLLLLGYGADAIRTYTGDGSRFGVHVRSVVEEVPRGSAGAVIAARDELAERFLVLYCDTMLDVDLSRMWDFHSVRHADATLLVHPNDHPFDSDLVRVDASDRITAFTRWTGEGLPRNLVSAALYMMERATLTRMESREGVLDFGRHVFPALLAQGAQLAAYRSVEYIKDLGTPERLAKVNADLASGKVDPSHSGRARAAVFIDRDGTLNVDDKSGVLTAADVELLPGAAQAVKRFQAAGFAPVVITNQPYVAMGKLTAETLDSIHAALEGALAREHTFVDAIYYCPHHPHAGFSGEISSLKIACECRKPAPGLIQQAERELHLDLKRSWMIGDQTADLELAARAGLRSVLVRTGIGGKDGKYPAPPTFTFNDVDEAARFVVDGYPAMKRRADEIAATLSPGGEVLIGGPARAGKTTWTHVLAESLRDRGMVVFLLSLDDWLRDAQERGRGVAERYDLSAVARLLAELRLIREPNEVALPVYDRFARRRVGERRVWFQPGSVVIVEGVLALDVAAPQARRFSVDVPASVRRCRFDAFYRWRGEGQTTTDALWNEREQDEIPVLSRSFHGAEALRGEENAYV